MNKIKELKELCKQMANSIRAHNRAWKEHQRSGADWSRWMEISKTLPAFHSSAAFRHHHIAYCMLRGTPYERIEPKVLPGNEPDWDKIEQIKEKFKDSEGSGIVSESSGGAG
jgi:hypothetical protein